MKSLTQLAHDSTYKYEIKKERFFIARHDSSKFIETEIAYRYKLTKYNRSGNLVKDKSYKLELLNNQIRVTELRTQYVMVYTFEHTKGAQDMFAHITGFTLTIPNTSFESFEDQYWFTFGDISQMPNDVYVRFCNWAIKNKLQIY